MASANVAENVVFLPRNASMASKVHFAKRLAHTHTHTETCLFLREKVKSVDHHHAEKGRQKGNNENKKAERGNNDRPATDGGLEVETDGCRGFSFCLFLHPPSLSTLFLCLLFLPFSPLFSFSSTLSIKMPLFRTLAKKS